jgi:hypothetical protein
MPMISIIDERSSFTNCVIAFPQSVYLLVVTTPIAAFPHLPKTGGCGAPSIPNLELGPPALFMSNSITFPILRERPPGR